MNLVLQLPTNIVLALLTAAAEIFLLPLTRLTNKRIEGWLIQQELMGGHLIEARRTEFGPFLIPVGRKTPLKLAIVLSFSGGVIIAVAFAEFGFEQVAHVRDVNRVVDTVFVSTRDNITRSRLFREKELPINVTLLQECVEIGKLRCKQDHGDRTCIRSIYFQAFKKDQIWFCADKATNLLRNASDIDVVLYDNLTATISRFEEKVDLDPETGIANFPSSLALPTQIEIYGKFLDGFILNTQDSERGPGTVVFWNESALFYTMPGASMKVRLGQKIPVEMGFFPNSGLTGADYSDAGMSIALSAFHRTRSIDVALVNMHFASMTPINRKTEFIDSEIVQVTTVRTSSIIAIIILVAVLSVCGILPFRKRSSLGSYNGLSRQYDEEIENRGESENPQHYATVGLIVEDSEAGFRIGLRRKRSRNV